MPSLDDAARDHGGVSLDDPRLVVVHLPLHGPDMEAPGVDEAREWAGHYGLDRRENHLVLLGDASMLGSETFDMIPGLQLVDRDFRLRDDAAGRNPAHDLSTELLPALAGVLAESERVASR
jgi:hypothetical protein